MKKTTTIFLALSLIFTLYSCQDVITLDLPEGEKAVVINGIVSDTVPVWAEVLQTAAYNEDGPLPAIIGATVFLYENNILVAQLLLDTANIYTANFVGTVGNTYFLQVALPPSVPDIGSTIWRSQEELLKPTAPIDSIYQKYLPEDVFQDEGRYVFYHFSDPPGKGDRYRIRVWQNDTLGAEANDITIFEDDFIDGRSFNDLDLNAIQVNGKPAPVDKTFKIQHSGITKEYHDYLMLVREQVVQVGGLFDPPPALLKGNIYGVTHPNKLALGFFAATGLNFAEYKLVE